MKLIVAALSAGREALAAAKTALAASFGDVDCESDILPWNETAYYRTEMGEALLRQLLAFKTLVSPESLAAAKLETNAIEMRLAATAKGNDEGALRRRVNLDPGYLDRGKLVLASTKAGPHRLYLSQGIYAEITLLYHHEAFHPLEYTYPDYRWAATTAFLLEARRRYLAQSRRKADRAQARSAPR